MAEIKSAVAPERKKNPKIVKSIEHERSANGGHVFNHRFDNSGDWEYANSETFTFGPDESEKAMAHFAKMAGISGGDEKETKRVRT